MAYLYDDLNKKNTFSAFRLFYNEFIYKENVMINYSKIRRYIVNIRNLSLEMRRLHKGNKELYNIKLERINARMKKQLYTIQVIEPYLYEVYYIIYKNKVSIGTDSVNEMPFIISCSFYEDYRLDSRNVDLGKYGLIPRFTSDEKRKIRGIAAKKGEIKYFKDLLEKCNDKAKYSVVLNKINYLLSVEPLYEEDHYNFMTRIEQEILILKRMLERYSKKARNCADYGLITETLDVAFKKDYSNWAENLADAFREYYKKIYEEVKSNKMLLFEEFVANDMSYETFLEFTKELEKEKLQFDSDFQKGKKIYCSFKNNSYCASFRKKMICDYYDIRLYFDVDINSSLDDVAIKAISLYRLAHDLEIRVFAKVLFDASHSLELKRNNDVRNAILKKIYELYDPTLLFESYEKLRKQYLDLVKEKGEEFSRNLTIIVNELKNKEGFKGEIPTLEDIKNNLVKKKKDFILENCFENILSRDFEGYYDTRDYDLKIIAVDIPIDEMTNLYFLLKKSIRENCVEDEREKFSEALLSFIANDILTKLDIKYDKLDKIAYEAALNDVAHEYLLEEIKSENQKVDKKTSANKNMLKANYDISREEFYQNSEFYQLNMMVNNLLKNKR